MVINRRHFLGTSLAFLGAGASIGFAAPQAIARFAGTAKEGDHYVAALYDGAGQVLKKLPLADRGHGLCVSADRQTLGVFARRPGFYISLFDLQAERKVIDIHPVEGRHFYGHGFFSPDGQILYATENDYEGERGVIGLYDRDRGFERIGEMETGDIGPHEAVLMQDQKTIAVANGGIATHPDFPRQKLNLGDMTPSLSYLDRQTGTILEQVRLPQAMHQLSIRHLAEGPNRTIWFAGQYQGPRTEIVDIVGYHKRGMPAPVMVPLGDDLSARLQNYGGSVSANLATGKIAVTSPRGGVMMLFDGESHKLEQVIESADICAVSPSKDGFVASTGQGKILLLQSDNTTPTDLRWDNHSLAL